MNNLLILEKGLAIYTDEDGNWRVAIGCDTCQFEVQPTHLLFPTKLEAIYYASTVGLGIPYQHYQDGIAHIHNMRSKYARKE